MGKLFRLIKSAFYTVLLITWFETIVFTSSNTIHSLSLDKLYVLLEYIFVGCNFLKHFQTVFI